LNHRPDLALGEEPEQHDLRLRGEVADLVQEDGPAVGHGQKARVSLDGPRERAALVAEEFAAQQLPGQAAAVDRLEPGRSPPGTWSMLASPSGWRCP
jgi:hypothetical protein